jgi:hypothetical protein
MWSKLRFSLIRKTTCLIGHLVSKVEASTTGGAEVVALVGGEDEGAVPEAVVHATAIMARASRLASRLAIRVRGVRAGDGRGGMGTPGSLPPLKEAPTKGSRFGAAVDPAAEAAARSRNPARGLWIRHLAR